MRSTDPETQTEVAHDLMCLIRISPEFLGDLLQLPKGAYVDAIQTEDQMCGVFRMRVRGMGRSVEPGQLIPEARADVMCITTFNDCKREVHIKWSVVE